MAGFDKYWDCPKKHIKRTKYWLPQAKLLKATVGDQRAFRYLTFCARSMIDVFLLAREKILEHEIDAGTISEVVFCEENPQDHQEITSILGVEGSGFPNKLENLILFQDDRFTEPYKTIANIDDLFGKEGYDLRPRSLRPKLDLKKQHLQLFEKFPFDFINLDFCGYYYPPPDILKINETVRKILELQLQQGDDNYGKPVTIDRFLLSVTCRFDDTIHADAWTRLEKIVKDNLANQGYQDAIDESKRLKNLQDWRKKDPFDFFLSAWPKEILAFSKEFGWKMEIKDAVYYMRGEGRHRFKIVCLVAEFEKSNDVDFYLQQAIRTLDRDLRTFIGAINNQTPDAKKLLGDLKSLVDMRNEKARKIGVKELSKPVFH